MKRLIIYLFATLALTASVAAEEPAKADKTPKQRYIVREPINILGSSSQAGHFNSLVIFIADQLERNVDKSLINNTVLVTSFVNLNRLGETSSLGRLIAENITHELHVRRWTVYDIRLAKDVTVSDTGEASQVGEFALSRNIKNIRDSFKIGAIVTGTYSINNSSIIVNARAIDSSTGHVLSSAQAAVPINAFSESLLYQGGDALSVMKIKGEAGHEVKP